MELNFCYSQELRQRLGHRLTICDLLIKPVQRITKYVYPPVYCSCHFIGFQPFFYTVSTAFDLENSRIAISLVVFHSFSFLFFPFQFRFDYVHCVNVQLNRFQKVSMSYQNTRSANVILYSIDFLYQGTRTRIVLSILPSRI